MSRIVCLLHGDFDREVWQKLCKERLYKPLTSTIQIECALHTLNWKKGSGGEWFCTTAATYQQTHDTPNNNGTRHDSHVAHFRARCGGKGGRTFTNRNTGGTWPAIVFNINPQSDFSSRGWWECELIPDTLRCCSSLLTDHKNICAKRAPRFLCLHNFPQETNKMKCWLFKINLCVAAVSYGDYPCTMLVWGTERSGKG